MSLLAHVSWGDGSPLLLLHGFLRRSPSHGGMLFHVVYQIGNQTGERLGCMQANFGRGTKRPDCGVLSSLA